MERTTEQVARHYKGCGALIAIVTGAVALSAAVSVGVVARSIFLGFAVLCACAFTALGGMAVAAAIELSREVTR